MPMSMPHTIDAVLEEAGKFASAGGLCRSTSAAMPKAAGSTTSTHEVRTTPKGFKEAYASTFVDGWLAGALVVTRLSEARACRWW